MSGELSDRYAAAESSVVDWEGAPAYALYEFTVIPACFVIEFVAAVEIPVQGLRLKIRGGSLTVDDARGTDLVLWRDTSPDRIVVQVQVSGRGKPSLKVWNVWREGPDQAHAVTHAWLGNAGMRVDEHPDAGRTDLRCSDGRGPASFDDLQARIVRL